MEKLTFTTIINAPREKVWKTMLEKDTYEQWAEIFQKGSTFEGSWDEGSDIIFTGPSDDASVSGMYAKITAHRPQEFVSIRHIGEIKNGEKRPWPTVEGQEGYENYMFKDVDGGTEVLVELMVASEWKDMFAEMWPKALAKLKEVAER